MLQYFNIDWRLATLHGNKKPKLTDIDAQQILMKPQVLDLHSLDDYSLYSLWFHQKIE